MDKRRLLELAGVGRGSSVNEISEAVQSSLENYLIINVSTHEVVDSVSSRGAAEDHLRRLEEGAGFKGRYKLFREV